ncbi:hypothetical protein ES705_39560 [subsurface metagenome]
MKELQIKIINNLGQTIFTEELKLFKGIYKKQLDLNAYKTGIYNLQLYFDELMITKKIIKE